MAAANVEDLEFIVGKREKMCVSSFVKQEEEKLN